jgi:RHS repeat-associated protein
MYAATSGYRNDGDAGLMHVGARYYDAQVGRFTSRDTFLDQKPYLYCEHDPVNAVDPSGHFPWGKLIIGFGALIAVPVMIYEVWDGFKNGNESHRKLKKIIKAGDDSGLHERADDPRGSGNPDGGHGLPKWSEDPTPWLN